MVIIQENVPRVPIEIVVKQVQLLSSLLHEIGIATKLACGI